VGAGAKRRQALVYIENGTSLRKDIHNFLVASVEKGQKIHILENQNRKRNLKNRKKDSEEKCWSAYKKAPGTQTSEKNSEMKKGGNAAEAQSLKKEEAPKWKATLVPFGLKKIEAAKWLARRAMGATEDKLTKELREYQRQRKHHEMLVPVMLTALNNGKTRAVKALLDNGCTTTCIDRDYAKAEGFELQELDVHIVARNADGTENIRGKITHYVEMIMTIRPHSE
jgi:hypothetical protein